MRDLKVSKKLFVSFGAVLLLLAVVIVVSVTSLASVSDGLELFYKKPFVNVSEANQLSIDLVSASKNMLHACLDEDKDETEKRLSMAQESFSSMEESVAVLKENYAGDQAQVTGISDSVASIESRFSDFEKLCKANEIEAAFHIYTDQPLADFTVIDNNVADIIDAANGGADSTYTDGQKQVRDLPLRLLFLEL